MKKKKRTTDSTETNFKNIYISYDTMLAAITLYVFVSLAMGYYMFLCHLQWDTSHTVNIYSCMLLV